MMSFPAASIHGRFQIIHHEHYDYFRRAAERYGRLYIGLTGQWRDLGDGSARLSHAMNPLTYWERVEMWCRMLQASGHVGEGHIIGPFPVEASEFLPDFVPKSCVCATTIREPWNEEKVRRLEQIGYRVDVLDRNFEKAVTATQIRSMILRDVPGWKDLLPPGVADFLETLDIRSRLAE